MTYRRRKVCSRCEKEKASVNFPAASDVCLLCRQGGPKRRSWGRSSPQRRVCVECEQSKNRRCFRRLSDTCIVCEERRPENRQQHLRASILAERAGVTPEEMAAVEECVRRILAAPLRGRGAQAPEGAPHDVIDAVTQDEKRQRLLGSLAIQLVREVNMGRQGAA